MILTILFFFFFETTEAEAPVSNFEPNDNEDAACDLLDHAAGTIEGNYYELNGYSFSIEEKLSMNLGFKDKDYYYITVLTDSNVQISVTTLAEDDLYDFEIYKMNYEWAENGSVYQTQEYLYRNYDDYCYKEFEFFATPGTYFIFLRGQQEMNSTYEIYYELNVSSQKNS